MIDVLKIVNWFKVRNYSDMKTNDNVEALTQLKVMKLLYYAQGVSLAVYDKVLFPEKFWLGDMGLQFKKFMMYTKGQER
jgi:uncharacterized phage-associated protein